jgi:hypothetical protein
VLKTPPDPRHRQYLTETKTAGPVAVHLARARGGLLAGFVIAADTSSPASKVLAEAERIVTTEAHAPGSVERMSLFELPLGAAAVWTISEEPDVRPGPFDHGERFTSVLPAWSAETKVGLIQPRDLGFGSAAAAIARAVELSDWNYDARQAAVARYSAVGFEAAAVTGLAVAVSGRRPTPGTPRRATIRFSHPYAVVAATFKDPYQPSPSAWHGLPVFSAWITTPNEA